MKTSIILNTDSYKYSMPEQYPPGTETVYSYIESRENTIFEDVVMFGLQAYMREFLTKKVTISDIDEAESIVRAHGLPFDRSRWEYIVYEHLGYLPVKIEAYDEGSVVPCGKPLLTIQNTDPNCYWLTTHLETSLLRAIWYPSTVATISNEIKMYLKAVMETSCDDLSKLPFMLHDFGARGVSSEESAMLGGLAHLINFQGTDNVQALMAARSYYDADGVVGFSIPAMEHSTVTSWGRDGEAAAFSNMLDAYGDGALLACVSDSYDLDSAVLNIWGNELKEKVQDTKALVVIRPDSGNPCSVVHRTIENLASEYGYTMNSKDHKVLNHVRVIQGDGIDIVMITDICDRLLQYGWSIDNVAFGMGGALLQHCDRDWGAWAMKCSAIKVSGEWRDVYKDPITDIGKKSKRGRFNDPNLKVKFLNGASTGEKFESIRTRLEKSLG